MGSSYVFVIVVVQLKDVSPTGVKGVIWPANKTHILKSLTLTDRREQN